MKKGLMALAAVVMLTSCGGSDDDNKAPAVLADVSPIVNDMKSGTWRVTEYKDNGDDETNHFTGYNFTFSDGDAVSATDGVNSVAGAWLVTNYRNDDDSPDDYIDFNLFFESPAHFNDIEDDWDIVSRTPTKIVLTDNGDSGTDTLVLEKN